MILTTGYIEHREIANYMGLLSVSHVIGLNAVKDFFASITDITGGRVKGYETEISKGIDEILNLLSEEAQKMQADAVMSIRMTFTVFSPSQKGTVVAITGYGTAVKLKDKKTEINNFFDREINNKTEKETRPRFTGGVGFEWGK